MALAPCRVRTLATVHCGRPRSAPSAHPPFLRSPSRTARFLGILSCVCPASPSGPAWDTQWGLHPASVGAWPRTPSPAVALTELSTEAQEEEAAEAGQAAAQPARLEDPPGLGEDSLPGTEVASPRAQTVRIAFIFLPFQYINRPKSKIYFTADSPPPSVPGLLQGTWGQRHASSPSGAERAALAEAPTPRTLWCALRGQAAWGVLRQPRGRSRRCPRAEPTSTPPGESRPPPTPAPVYLGGLYVLNSLSVLTSYTRLSALHS